VDDRTLWNALRCPCGVCVGTPDEDAARDALAETARWLRRVEAALGGHAVEILFGGGWRCLAYTDQVAEPNGGAHREGKAADIAVASLSPSTVQKMLVARPELVTGLGSYRGYSHIHWGTPPQKWRG
jgi:Peptidase M15